MRVYLAGFSFAIPWRAINTLSLPARIRELLSYWDFLHIGSGRIEAILRMERTDLFLDSGAFSAWTRGVQIDLQEYARFVLAHPGMFSVVANLDVIPGAWGVVPSQDQIDQSAARGWENYWYLVEQLKSLGMRPMHIYHQGEDIKWLKKLIEEADYFGVSPGNDRTTEQKIAWLDEIMPLLVDTQGLPIRKFHGFGVTSLEILLRYPWWSADSTSWILTGRYGSCFIPLDGKVYKVCFSDKSPNLKEAGKHFKTYSHLEQRAIQQYLEEKGFTPTQLAEEYQKRDELNIIFFLDLEKNWVLRPFRREQVQPGFALA